MKKQAENFQKNYTKEMKSFKSFRESEEKRRRDTKIRNEV
eukprot:UN25690